MTDINARSLRMVAHYLCDIFGIEMAADDLVLFIGSDESNNNADAIKEWIELQGNLPSHSRQEVAIELRDRLHDLLFEIESGIRSAS